MKRSGFKRKFTKPLKRTKLNVVGHSTTAQDRQRIQDLVRLICCFRDGGCVLRTLRHCGGEAVVEIDDKSEYKIISNNVIQADHLVTRANSATYADTRLIVCLCKNCHAWKHWNEKEYEKLVRLTLSNDRKNLWDKCELDRQAHKTYKPDWKLAILALEKELKEYE